MDPIHKVHRAWMEQTADNNIEWTLNDRDSYGVPEGGPKVVGPSKSILCLARCVNNISCIFLVLIPLPFFDKVAELTNNYAYKDFVVESAVCDRDEDLKRRSISV